jgi:hypothetical protein
VIKVNFTPFIAAMAALTGSFPVIFFIQEKFMDIIMAIDTADTNLSETPFVILFMTGKTGCGQVGAFQLKFSLVMPFNGKIGPFKAKGAMTIGTVRRTALIGKLFFVVIGMAIGTSMVFDRRCIPGFMAAGASNILMFSSQGKIGQGMVEITYLLDPSEGFFGMAFTAVLPEFIIMNILVATCAIFKCYTCKLLYFNPIVEG